MEEGGKGGMTGKEKLIRQFLADDIKYMFGNPGTVEEGFLDVLSDYPDLQYITCLHESVAVAMADGYARKSKSPALIQLHSGVGLGNGIGMLYQAYRGHTPLIVIAGEAGIAYDSMDAQMACDLVAMAKPVTKYAARVVHKDSLLRLVRRAVKMAVTPPMGPVFLCLPMDILDEINTEDVYPSIRLDMEVSPRDEVVADIAKLLSEAENPIILAGDGVNEAGASAELEECARLLAAKVYGVNTSCINISQTSMYYQGDLGHMFGTNSAEKVKDADAVLIIGTYIFPEVFPNLKHPFSDNCKIIHIDLDTYEIAKNHYVTVAAAAHPKRTLAALNYRLGMSSITNYDKRKKALAQQADAIDSAQSEHTALTVFLEEISKQNNSSLILFDEALTVSSYVQKYLPKEKDGSFFQTRGGSLGVGIPGGMGIWLADKKSDVLVFTGDGGSMYTIQALYTAIRYHIPVKIVVCKNNKYGLLEDNIKHYWKENEITDHTVPDCFELFDKQTDIDFAALALSMGMEATRAASPEDAVKAAKKLMENRNAYLVELII